MLALLAVRFCVPDDYRVIPKWDITLREILLFAACLIFVIAVLVITHLGLKYSIITRYGILLRRLEENESTFRHGQVKRWTNYDLRRLAKLLSRLPLALGTRHPDVVLSAAAKGAYVRRLQVCVAKPRDDHTCAWLHDVLLNSLKTYLDRRWEDLPYREPDASDKINRWQKIEYGLLGLIFAVGAVVLVTNGTTILPKYPSLVPTGTTLLGMGAYLSLSQAGLIPGSLQQALDTAKTLSASHKE
jgi:hypothetical protein